VEGSQPIPEELWRVIRELMLGNCRTGLARLRELVAEDEARQSHAKGRQIMRVEEVFRKEARNEPWPSMPPGDRIHWRGVLGGLLNELPLARVIEDLQATAAGKKSLIYYLSSAGGTRASRWEMLLCRFREEEWQQEKAREKQQANEFFRHFGNQTPLPEAMLPEWVRRLKIERQAIEIEMSGEISLARRHECSERAAEIEAALIHHGYG